MEELVVYKEYNHGDGSCVAKWGISGLKACSGFDRRKASDPWDQNSRLSCVVSSSSKAAFRRFLVQRPFPDLSASLGEAVEVLEGAYALKETTRHLGCPKAVRLVLKRSGLCPP